MSVLYNGHDYLSTALPWSYAPKWLLISTPPVVLAGALMSVPVSRGREWNLARSALWAVVVLPVLLVVVRHSSLYDGIRHLLFIYPVLVVLSASGWAGFMSDGNRPWVRRSALVLLAAGLVHILAFNVRFYPNQTTYFNELVGGPRGAFGRFEMDYWGNCILAAVAWSARAAESSGRPLTVSGWPEHLVQLNAERFPQLSATARSEGRQHLTILLNRDTAAKVRELANRLDPLYRVQTADGAVLCVVVPGPAFQSELARYFLFP